MVNQYLLFILLLFLLITSCKKENANEEKSEEGIVSDSIVSLKSVEKKEAEINKSSDIESKDKIPIYLIHNADFTEDYKTYLKNDKLGLCNKANEKITDANFSLIGTVYPTNDIIAVKYRPDLKVNTLYEETFYVISKDSTLNEYQPFIDSVSKVILISKYESQNLLKEANKDSEVLALIPKGDKVELLEKTEIVGRVFDRFNFHWFYVRYGENEGFVKGIFFSPDFDKNILQSNEADFTYPEKQPWNTLRVIFYKSGIIEIVNGFENGSEFYIKYPDVNIEQMIINDFFNQETDLNKNILLNDFKGEDISVQRDFNDYSFSISLKKNPNGFIDFFVFTGSREGGTSSGNYIKLNDGVLNMSGQYD